MKVRELVEHLLTLDQGAEIYFSDGYWSECQPVWPPKHGEVPYSYGLEDNPHPGREVIGYYWSV